MLDLFRQDAARWVVPQQIGDPAAITLGQALKLLWNYVSLRAMLLYRFGSWLHRKRVRILPGMIQRLIFFLFGLEIVVGQEVGGGLYIAHPSGTVISVERLGRNCSIIASVTIGMRNEWAFPRIEDGVFIGAGARVLGNITVGEGSVIGANAVVIEDVPAGATVVGIPARIIRMRNDLRAEKDEVRVLEVGD